MHLMDVDGMERMTSTETADIHRDMRIDMLATELREIENYNREILRQLWTDCIKSRNSVLRA